MNTVLSEIKKAEYQILKEIRKPHCECLLFLHSKRRIAEGIIKKGKHNRSL
jgi:hypothetical protein